MACMNKVIIKGKSWLSEPAFVFDKVPVDGTIKEMSILRMQFLTTLQHFHKLPNTPGASLYPFGVMDSE